MQKCGPDHSSFQEEISDMTFRQASARFEFPCMWSNDELKEEIITLRPEDLVDYMRKQEMIVDSIEPEGADAMTEDPERLTSLCANASLGKWLDKYEYTPL